MHGIAFMILAIGLLSIMDALAKWSMAGGMSVMQILALRSVVIIPMMLLAFVTRNRLTTLKPTRPLLHVYRGLIGFIAPLAFFLGISRIPLTDAVAVFFSSIFIITLLSQTFLGEKVGVHRWASVIAGFVGVLVVVGPKGGGEVLGYCLVLTGSAAYSVLFISGRYLSSTESVPSLVFSYNLSVGVISLLLLPWFWVPLVLDQYLMVLGLALLAVSGHYFMTLAFSVAQASLIAPFEYTAVLWALAFDLMIWHTVPSASTVAGATIIIASGLYIVHRERVGRSALV